MRSVFTKSALRAFREEMRKIAAVNPAVGAGLTLATLGALGGGVSRYYQAKLQGSSTGDALGEGLRGGLTGAAAGGLVGAGIGGTGVGGAISRFGQRQLHGLTGWAPEGGLHAMRAGSYNAKQRMARAQAALRALEHSGGTAQQAARLQQEARRAAKGLAAAIEAERMGLTSLPGYVRAIGKHGLVPVLQAGAREQLQGTSTAQKALILGLPAYGALRAWRSPADERDSRGLSRGARIGESVGSLVGGVVGGAVPIVGQLALQEGTGRVGRAVGGFFDRRRQPPPAFDPTDPVTAPGQVTPSEYVLSPRASGDLE